MDGHRAKKAKDSGSYSETPNLTIEHNFGHWSGPDEGDSRFQARISNGWGWHGECNPIREPMITICPGWNTLHTPPVIVREEDGGEPGVSHGACPECAAWL